ncbi:hypothetical protein TSA1_19835 [Bradyrhizobium nitroreducens]|uniref:Uncharacterized protein n=1 Tax=Bradyrhizobium nitroreducens TaxID=709803 RepID=A0A2M6UDQ4_9BRAD|nr:hypothetical protein TSA1_19835 [Bradyrhizobium nitroreducens]
MERYGELLTCQIVALYNAIHDLPPRSAHTLARLKQLFHESEGLPATSKILLRPDYQWRYGYNHQTIYRRAMGTSRLLHAKGLLDPMMMRWANTTRVVQLSDDPRQEPSDHDAGLSLVMSSIEIGVRRKANLRFISHLEILRHASSEAQNAQSPLSIPLPQLRHTFPDGKSIVLADVHVKPDAMFGIGYERDHKFFALEFDRSTEDVEPTKNLQRASWLRKILSYSSASVKPKPVYQTYLKIPNLLVLCVFSDATRMAHVMRLTKAHAIYPAQFLFKAIPPVDPLLNATTLLHLASEPWQRIGGAFNLLTAEEGR